MLLYFLLNLLLHFQWQNSWLSVTKRENIFFNFLWHFQWQNWRKSGTKKQKEFFLILCDISSGKNHKIYWTDEGNGKILDYRWQKGKISFLIYCDISSGKIEENLGLKSKKNFFEFFVTFPVAKFSVTWDKKRKDFFWIFCDISSGKNHKISWTNEGKFFLFFCDISSGNFEV